MNESILKTIADMVGTFYIEESSEGQTYKAFNTSLIAHINSAFSELTQLGVGPLDGFTITGDEETWEDFSDDSSLIAMVKPCVYYKVKLGFDAPATSFAIEALKDEIARLEWRLRTMVEDED